MAQRSKNVDQLVDHLFRQEFGRMVSRLARILGAPRLAMAEDAVQYAMLQALQLWPYQGAPEYPQAWLAKVAYHRALDVLKSERKLRFYDDENEFELRNQIEELQTIGSVGVFPVFTGGRRRTAGADFCVLPSRPAASRERCPHAQSGLRFWSRRNCPCISFHRDRHHAAARARQANDSR